jgi:hypothetical protein
MKLETLTRENIRTQHGDKDTVHCLTYLQDLLHNQYIQMNSANIVIKMDVMQWCAPSGGSVGCAEKPGNCTRLKEQNELGVLLGGSEFVVESYLHILLLVVF